MKALCEEKYARSKGSRVFTISYNDLVFRCVQVKSLSEFPAQCKTKATGLNRFICTIPGLFTVFI